MHRMLKWMFPALRMDWRPRFAANSPERADAPASQPANGTIVVKVVDTDSKPVVGATVRLNHRAPAGQNGGGRGGNRQPPLASGTSDDSGSYTFKAVANGDYTVTVAVTPAAGAAISP